MDVTMPKALLLAMLDFAMEQHPHEIVLLLRGRVGREHAKIEDFLLPPLAVSGNSFAEFPLHKLPIDFTIIGTGHSHPSGHLAPSVGDLNNFYGRIMLIFARPYRLSNAAVFNARGEKLSLSVSD